MTTVSQHPKVLDISEVLNVRQQQNYTAELLFHSFFGI